MSFTAIQYPRQKEGYLVSFLEKVPAPDSLLGHLPTHAMPPKDGPSPFQVPNSRIILSSFNSVTGIKTTSSQPSPANNYRTNIAGLPSSAGLSLTTRPLSISPRAPSARPPPPP